MPVLPWVAKYRNFARPLSELFLSVSSSKSLIVIYSLDSFTQ